MRRGGFFDDVAHTLRAGGFDASEDGTGRGTPLVATPILEAGARTGKSTTDIRAGSGIGDDGDPMFTLQRGKQHAVEVQQVPELSNALEAQAGQRNDPTHQVFIPIAFNWNAQVDQMNFDPDTTPSLTCSQGAAIGPVGAAKASMAVRRLTPEECEKLQGFAPGWTNIPWRGKPTAPDGPRYKALGNSMAVPCMAWIGKRIAMVDAKYAATEQTASISLD